VVGKNKTQVKLHQIKKVFELHRFFDDFALQPLQEKSCVLEAVWWLEMQYQQFSGQLRNCHLRSKMQMNSIKMLVSHEIQLRITRLTRRIEKPLASSVCRRYGPLEKSIKEPQR
jgi:hypothetical protein